MYILLALLLTVTPVTAHHSETFVCDSLAIELYEAVREGYIKEQDAEDILLRCYNLE